MPRNGRRGPKLIIKDDRRNRLSAGLSERHHRGRRDKINDRR